MKDLEEMAYFTKRFEHLTRKKRFLGRSNGSKRSVFKTKGEDQDG